MNGKTFGKLSPGTAEVRYLPKHRLSGEGRISADVRHAFAENHQNNINIIAWVRENFFAVQKAVSHA